MKTVSYVVLVTEDEILLCHTNSRYAAEKRARSWKRQHLNDKVQIAIRREVLGIKVTTDFEEVLV